MWRRSSKMGGGLTGIKKIDVAVSSLSSAVPASSSDRIELDCIYSCFECIYSLQEIKKMFPLCKPAMLANNNATPLSNHRIKSFGLAMQARRGYGKHNMVCVLSRKYKTARKSMMPLPTSSDVTPYAAKNACQKNRPFRNVRPGYLCKSSTN